MPIDLGARGFKLTIDYFLQAKLLTKIGPHELHFLIKFWVFRYNFRRAFDLTPNDLDIHRPGEDPLAGQLCDVCDKKKEKAKVYCVSCPKKLCKEHEQVSVRVVKVALKINLYANNQCKQWRVVFAALAAVFNRANRWICLNADYMIMHWEIVA